MKSLKAARRRVPLTVVALNVLARRMAGLKTPFLFPWTLPATRPVPKVNNAHDRAVKASKVAPFRTAKGYHANSFPCPLVRLRRSRRGDRIIFTIPLPP